jgi:peroxiredoxin Q/BCP
MTLSPGDPAPDFTALTDDGQQLQRSSLRGRRVILYFYPKDDTPGCTTEACDFRDLRAQFEDKDAVILGVSPDGQASHARFRDKHALNFRLLCDPDHAIAMAYGVWREKKNYGRTYMGITRATFVIDPDGKIEAIYDNVRAAGHAAKVLAAL